MENYFIVAFLTDAVSLDTCEPIYAIASKTVNDEWYTCEGSRCWPYWFKAIDIERLAPLPEQSDIDFLHAEAAKFAASKPKVSPLTALLGLNKPKAQAKPIPRRL